NRVTTSQAQRSRSARMSGHVDQNTHLPNACAMVGHSSSGYWSNLKSLSKGPNMILPASAALANLARIGKLKAEPPDARERADLLRSASVRLLDARQPMLSLESRFDLAYNAAHAAALSALRAHGYRSENRFLVFQCLEHTLGYKPEQWLLLNHAHKKRNLAEYEGDLDVTDGFVAELIEHVANLIMPAQALDTK
ncbi:hypothetical protein QN360_20990, partial [Glaciimonas sp. CA11.2]|uniref:hypothetical protein n=2 Tax=Glaciimonas sp. CA11.2 TaxID=3048601 RepID=UPI002B23BAE3